MLDMLQKHIQHCLAWIDPKYMATVKKLTSCLILFTQTFCFIYVLQTGWKTSWLLTGSYNII